MSRIFISILVILVSQNSFGFNLFGEKIENSILLRCYGFEHSTTQFIIREIINTSEGEIEAVFIEDIDHFALKDLFSKDSTLYSTMVYGSSNFTSASIDFFKKSNQLAFDSLSSNFRNTYNGNLEDFILNSENKIFSASEISWVVESFSAIYKFNEIEEGLFRRGIDKNPVNISDREWLSLILPDANLLFVKDYRSVDFGTDFSQPLEIESKNIIVVNVITSKMVYDEYTIENKIEGVSSYAILTKRDLPCRIRFISNKRKGRRSVLDHVNVYVKEVNLNEDYFYGS